MLLVSVGISMMPAAGVSAHAPTSVGTVDKGPLAPPPTPSKPLQPPPKNLPDRTKITRSAAPSQQGISNATIDMKILVLASDGNEADLPAIKQALDYLGTPYTVYIAAQSPGGLTAAKLTDPANAAHAFYQGVILTTGDLAYSSPSGWASALNATEWTTLINFESSFGIRRISWYTYPSPDYGFQYGGTGVDTSSTPLNASFTADGKTIFGFYVNTGNPLPIQYAYTYLGTALDATTKPLLTDPSGKVLAALHTNVDSTGTALYDTIALTFDSNPYLTHDLVLSHGLITWLTKGFFLGERHAALTAQPDDIFNDNDMWASTLACGTNPDNTGITYRIAGSDIQALVRWQQAKQSNQVTSQFRIEMPFNGIGTTATFLNEEGNPAGQFKPDTLTPAAKQQQGQFNWISHTYDHTNLDAMSAADMTTELSKNNDVATSLKLQNYTKATLVTPDVSGLTNANALQAMYTYGVRYVVSDTSKAGYGNPTPNTGITNPLQPGILMIPRHPTNLYFNVQKPADWVAEDNCLYPAGAYGHVDTYAQLLDRESTMLLSYLLRGDIDPLMFHQPNMGAYDGTHSLLGDLMDATFAKYSKLVSVPIQSPTQEQLGQKMAARMAYNGAGVTAKMVGAGTISVSAQKDATIPITGLVTDCSQCKAEPYAGQNITWVTLRAGQSVNLTIKNPIPAPPARLALTAVLPPLGLTNGNETVVLLGKGFDVGVKVTFDGQAATVTNVTSVLLTVKTPAHAAGTVPVTVTLGDQTSTITKGYVYFKFGSSDTGTGTTDQTPTPDPAPAPRPAPTGAGTTSGSGGPAPAPVPTGR